MSELCTLRRISAAIILGTLITLTFPVFAGEVVMKSGFTVDFEGNPVPVQGLTLDSRRQGNPGPVQNYPMTMFDAVSRRYFLPLSQIAETQLGDPFVDEFNIKVQPANRQQMFGSVGGFAGVTPFSEFGRRIVTLRGPKENLDVVQGISRIRPDYVQLTGINYNWEYNVATRTIPIDKLHQAMLQATNQASHEERLAIVRLLVDAEYYDLAQQELARIATDFPDLQERVNTLQLEIRQVRALQFLNEFRRRLAAGQYDLVYRKTFQFPRDDVNEATLAEIDKMQRDHELALDQIDRILAALSRLQGEVKQQDLLPRFRDMRAVVKSQLSRHTLERLTPFLQNIDDEFLPAEQKLALAYSAWVVGPSLADTDVDTAINYWDARDTVREYLLGTNTIQQSELLVRLKGIESIGPDVVEAIVRLMPPLYETSFEWVGYPQSLQTRDSEMLPYEVILPVGYNPHGKYPVIIALAADGVDPQQELLWWGGEAPSGPAHRNGYIVIAPHPSVGENSAVAGWPAESVIRVLRDARRRFAVDSDRVFLAGHGGGADAVFDIGMAHPHLFAGAIPILGETNEYAKHYWENSRHLPFYVVSGELDADVFERNAEDLTRMMKNRFDVVLVEYVQRGLEDYYEELPHILDWMRVHERAAQPLEIDMQTMRPADNRFYWLEFSGLPTNLTQPRVNRYGNALPPRPLPITGKITQGNTIYLTVGAERLTLWLSPELVDFEERLKVNWRRRTVFNEIPERSINDMLEHVYVTGDRDRLYWQRLSF